MSIHRPRAGKEHLTVDSMPRFQNAVADRPGARAATTFKDRRTGWLVGIAVLDDWESIAAARPAMEESTKYDRFDEWEEVEVHSFQLDEV